MWALVELSWDLRTRQPLSKQNHAAGECNLQQYQQGKDQLSNSPANFNSQKVCLAFSLEPWMTVSHGIASSRP